MVKCASMKNKRTIIALLFICLVTGCFQPEVPAIFDIRDSMVKVRVDTPTIYHKIDMEAVNKEAERGCDLYNKSATLLSSACVFRDRGTVCNTYQFLFSCS